ncbi:hypothetical protein [Aquimarina pacifica]|uniref:hypothetical protein n=1 Tax=Aquimarina pacifica TaxID=1296415 RepID=UPI0004712DB8|nr:hypothetical protein [Aquimarina pacifica]
MKNKIFLLTGLITASTFLFSCSKDDDSNSDNDLDGLIPDTEVTTSKQHKSIEEATNQINEISQNSFDSSSDRSSKKLRLKTASDCASIEENINENDLNSGTATIDFGDGCELEDGSTISGKILMSFVYEDTEDGILITSTQTMENLTIDDMSVSGTSTMTMVMPTFDFFDENIDEFKTSIEFITKLSFEWEDGLTASIEETMDEEIIQSFDFSNPNDSGSSITIRGIGSTKFSNGDTYSFTTSIPIILDLNCEYPLSGIILNTENTITTTLDFGNGECDSIAIETDADGNKTTIDLDTEEVII